MTRGVFEHFDAQARRYSERSSKGLWKPLREREARVVLAMLDPKPGDRILDAGCGAGFYSRLIQERGATVKGIDGAPEMVASARAGRVDAELFDLSSGPPPGAPYDKILCAGALEFCSDPKLVVANLLAGVSGPLVVLVPSDSTMAKIYRRYHRGHGLNIHLFDEQQLKHLAPAGAQLTEARRVAFSWVGRFEWIR